MPNKYFDARALELLKTLSDSRQLKHFYSLTGPLGATARIEGHSEITSCCRVTLPPTSAAAPRNRKSPSLRIRLKQFASIPTS